MAQFLGIFKSFNPFYRVTGTYDNPNVIAIFLALTVPVCLFFLKSRFKRLFQLCLLLILMALLLLQCRAAIIGVFLSAGVFYGLQYNVSAWIKNSKNKMMFRGIVILSALILIPLGQYLYNVKRASSEGRGFIWKVTALMAEQKPLTGWGYGGFERAYNLWQAAYVEQGKAVSDELKYAGPVIMPHNELLHHLAQGGLVGVFLMGLFFASLLPKTKNSISKEEQSMKTTVFKDRFLNTSVAGVIGFIGICMVNSAIQVIPAMIVLIFYAAIICSACGSVYSLKWYGSNSQSSPKRIVINAALILMCCLVLKSLLETAYADRQNKVAELLGKNNQLKEASLVMERLKSKLSSDRSYWKNYAILNIKEKQYRKALECFDESKKISALPDLFLGSAFCYEKLNMHAQAVEQYKYLVLLLPSKYSYRFKLMKAYINNRDTVNAVLTGKGILALQPKIPSPKVVAYKNRTLVLLKRLRPGREAAIAKKKLKAVFSEVI